SLRPPLDARGGGEATVISLTAKMFHSLAVSADGSRLAVGGGVWHSPEEGNVEVFDARTGKRLVGLAGKLPGARPTAFTRDGACVLAFSENDGKGVLWRWDAITGQPRGCVALQGGAGSRSGCAAFTADCTRLVMADWREITLWDVESGRKLAGISDQG